MSLVSNLIRYGSYGTFFIPGAQGVAPAVVAGANGVASQMENADAAKQANEQLQTGNNAALDTYKQQFSPYTNLGSQSANTLASLMGFSPLPANSTEAPYTPGNVEGYNTRTRPEDAPIVGHAQPRGTFDAGGSLSDLGQQVQSRANSRSSFVRMRAPDGTEEDVPQAQVKHFMELGAQAL